MLTLWGRRLVEFGVPTALLVAAEFIVPVTLAVRGEVSSWFSMLWSTGVGSLFEVIVVSMVVERALVGKPAWNPVLLRAKSRYLAVLLINLVGGVAVVAGILLLCIPGVLLGGLLCAAIPVAVIEGLGPKSAVVASLKRSWASWLKLSLVAGPMMFTTMLPELLAGLTIGASSVSSQPLREPVLLWLRVAPLIVSAVVKVASVLFQFVAWNVTRPTAAAPPVETQPLTA